MEVFCFQERADKGCHQRTVPSPCVCLSTPSLPALLFFFGLFSQLGGNFSVFGEPTFGGTSGARRQPRNLPLGASAQPLERLDVLPGLQQRSHGGASGQLLAWRSPVRDAVPRGQHQLQHPHHHGEWPQGRRRRKKRRRVFIGVFCVIGSKRPCTLPVRFVAPLVLCLNKC